MLLFVLITTFGSLTLKLKKIVFLLDYCSNKYI